MNESENPYKYGQILISKENGTKHKVLSVLFDIVNFSYGDNFEQSICSSYHWKEIKELYDLEPTKTWEPLTKKNWLERRDKGVWVKDEDDEMMGMHKLIYFDKNNDLFILEYSVGIEEYPNISIYNDNGEEAIWKEE